MTQVDSVEKIYLELTTATYRPVPTDPALSSSARIVGVPQPSYESFKAWHNEVGRPFGWHTRRRINNRNLVQSILSDEKVEMLLFCIADKEIGYSLMFTENAHQVEISDFGLLPQYTGKGFGSLFLGQLIDQFWAAGKERIWLSSRSSNHPKVIDFYARFGFRVYDRQLLS